MSLFNPFADGYAENPYTQYAAIREADPVHETDFGIWIVVNHADVRQILRDPSWSVDERNALDRPFGDVGGERRTMLDLDAPDHTRLRRLVSKAFTPRMVELLRDRVDEIVAGALDRAAADGGLDLMDDLAFTLPFTVITELLGMPETDTVELRRLTGTVVRGLEPVNDPELADAIDAAGEEIGALVTSAIDWKRTRLADDLLSALIAVEEQGDTLTNEELTGQVVLLYVAGHETTVNLIGNGMLALLHHPEQQDVLRHHPSNGPNAIDELLRYDSPVQMSRRIPLADSMVGGRRIPAGAMVICGLAAANRDPAKWGPSADTVDVRRADASDHVSFGGGHHHCLGAALARLEGEAAIGGLIQRFSHIDLAGEPEWNGRLNLRGLSRLPLSVS